MIPGDVLCDGQIVARAHGMGKTIVARKHTMNCTRDHEQLKLDDAAWNALEFVGIQDAYDGFGSKLEMCNCTCGTTLCREIPGDPWDDLTVEIPVEVLVECAAYWAREHSARAERAERPTRDLRA